MTPRVGAVEVGTVRTPRAIVPVTVMSHTGLAPAGTCVHDVEQAAEYKPAAHAEQVADPRVAEKEPTGQTEQTAAPALE